ncbi:MAG: alpha/beta hydrolase [Solobacterium sp.]|nr:alpha/beta hydrolase [Solobacterium sp.]
MGNVEIIKVGIAPLKQGPRKVYVYLPDGYDTTDRYYPVLYMFDGHNLFSDETATYGKSWGIKEFLDQHQIPLIVIGQDCNHTGDMRLMEYCPFPAQGPTWFPEGEVYGQLTADWFVNKLKPYCEKRYRIKQGRQYTGIAGSSMGGLMSMYCITAYNDVYSKAACLSSTMDINLKPLVQLIKETPFAKNTRIYMDYGSNEVKSKKAFAKSLDRMLTINHAFQRHHVNTWPNVIVGGYHSEATWETVVPLFLDYLYPELHIGELL